jgi:hypothetical protein
MTREEWQASTSPNDLLDFVRAGATDRKLRLFAAASCRTLGRSLSDPRSRRAVEAAERYADEQISQAELTAAWLARRVIFTW